MFDLLFYFALLLGVFPILLLKYKAKSDSKQQHPIAPFLYLVLFASIYEFVGTLLLQLPSAPWFMVYSLLEFFTLMYFFYHLLEKKFKVHFAVFGISYILLFLIVIFYWEESSSLKTDAYFAIIEIIMVYFFSILWFKSIFSNTSERDLLHSGNFSFVAGFILYLSGTFFLTLLGDSILKNEKLYLQDFWILNIVFNIILRLLLIHGVWKIQQK